MEKTSRVVKVTSREGATRWERKAIRERAVRGERATRRERAPGRKRAA